MPDTSISPSPSQPLTYHNAMNLPFSYTHGKILCGSCMKLRSRQIDGPGAPHKLATNSVILLRLLAVPTDEMAQGGVLEPCHVEIAFDVMADKKHSIHAQRDTNATPSNTKLDHLALRYRSNRPVLSDPSKFITSHQCQGGHSLARPNRLKIKILLELAEEYISAGSNASLVGIDQFLLKSDTLLALETAHDLRQRITSDSIFEDPTEKNLTTTGIGPAQTVLQHQSTFFVTNPKTT
ncbi:hypothetical protein K449DRAFT_439436 [Hypoxylon sp. EC38]|nr:hypothetical protein K449DRAFT_439436 [Hypoxylon sp. EC38]